MTKRKRTTQARRATDAQPTASSTAMADAVGAGSADGPAAAVAVGPSSAPPSRWRRWAAELGIPFGAFVVIEWALAALIGVLVIGAVLRGTAPTAPAAAPSFAKADQPITDAGAPTADGRGSAAPATLGGGAAGSNPFDSDTPNGAADAASTAPGTSIATIAGTTGSTVSAGQPAATGAPPAGASGAPSGSVRVRFGPGDQFSRSGDDDGPRGTAARRDPRHGAEHHRRPGRSAGGRDAATGDGHPTTAASTTPPTTRPTATTTPAAVTPTTRPPATTTPTTAPSTTQPAATTPTTRPPTTAAPTTTTCPPPVTVPVIGGITGAITGILSGLSS